jgi:diketogulonate reductase-like aldo/keto reductase
MNNVVLPAGQRLPPLGLGTWRMGEAARSRKTEVAAVRCALELGYRLIDTAEMYGEGGAEVIVGQALGEALRAGTVTREEVFIVSKVYPHNASVTGVQQACERSRRRLGLDTIDLYLLHWRGPHALVDTVAGFQTLQRDGHIRHWGVSNFDTHDMDELMTAPGGDACAANQVYYSLTERGAAFELLPWLQRHRMPLMAYCPIDQGRLVQDPVLQQLAQARGVTPAQLGLAWVMRQAGVVAIPKAVREAHLIENLAAVALQLDAQDLQALDERFPPPVRRTPLAMS